MSFCLYYTYSNSPEPPQIPIDIIKQLSIPPARPLLPKTFLTQKPVKAILKLNIVYVYIIIYIYILYIYIIYIYICSPTDQENSRGRKGELEKGEGIFGSKDGHLRRHTRSHATPNKTRMVSKNELREGEEGLNSDSKSRSISPFMNKKILSFMESNVESMSPRAPVVCLDDVEPCFRGLIDMETKSYIKYLLYII